MRKLFYLFLFFISAAAQSFPQIQMQVSKEKNTASYPIDGTMLLREEQQQVAEYIKSHPDYLNKMRLGKSTAWSFTVGSTKKWYAYNYSTGSYYQTDATCRAVGNKCYVFVEDSMWNTRVNQASVDSIVANFDNRTPADPNQGIYDTGVEIFGNEPNSDNDPKIIILILNVRDGFSGSGGYVGGYYSSLNQTALPNSNQADMMYVDANPTDLKTSNGLKNALATFAHEFQHMIHWNANQFDPDLTFMNEGASEVAEVICGYPMRTQHLYADETNRYLFSWRSSADDNVLNDYQRASRFFLNLLDQFGEGIFKPLVNSVTEGASAIETALIKNGTPKSFNNVFADWLIANKLDDRNVSPAYGYIHPNLQKVNSKATFTGPTGSDSDQLDNLAANYYTFTDGSNLTINFTVENNVIVKAIKIGDSQKQVSDVQVNTQTSIPGYGTTYHTVHFVVINLDHSSNRNYSFSASQTVATVQELKWDETEPVGYFNSLSQSDTICVTFDGVQGAKLDSIKVALRQAGSISGGIYEYTGNLRPTPLGEKLAAVTASISTTSPSPYPVPYQNWATIDLTSQDISADNQFAAAFVIGSDPSKPAIMITEYESTTPYHSFTYLNNPSGGGSPDWYYITLSQTTVGIYLIRAYVSFGATDVKQVIELAPKEFDLFQNYPNPFNPATTVSFYIPETEDVTLKIYNALGREIKTVISKNMQQGSHTINLDMRNEPSGVYFYRLSAGDFTETKKLMLLK